MPEIRDVIINVYSCSAQAPCHKWKDEFFTNSPIIINVPGGSSSIYRTSAIRWAKTGDAFKAAVKERTGLDIEVGKRGLTTFSLGWTFADELLKFKSERDKLDTYLLLDGCHTSTLDHWIQYAKRAAEGDAFMAMAHSSIVPPFVSTTVTNSKIFDEAFKLREKYPDPIEIPDYILHAKLPDKGVTISLGASPGLPAISKTWTEDPLKNNVVAGNLTRFHYTGNDRPDHVYIAWYVSKRLWNWFGDTWSEEKEEISPEPIPDVTTEDEPEPAQDPIQKPEQPEDNKEKATVTGWQAFIAVLLSFLRKLFS